MSMISAMDQEIGDLQAELKQVQEHLAQSENYNLQLEKQNDRHQEMILKLVDKALFGGRCCE